MGGAAIAGVGLGLSAYSTYKGYQAEQRAARYEAQQARVNAAIRKEQIKDVRFIGAQEIKHIEQEALQIGADQITAYSGAGIDISSAVVRERIEETAKALAADVLTAQHNLEKSVWGLEVGIMTDEASALFAKARAERLKKIAPIATGAQILTDVGRYSYLTRE